MAYDEHLAERIRSLLADDPVTEMKMFGGLAFLINGNMAVAAGGEGAMMVRCDPADAEAFIDDGAEPMVMRGRPMAGWLTVAHSGLNGDSLTRWVERGIGYAASLPPKPSR